MSLDLDKIKEELKTLPNYIEGQIGLQGTEDNNDPFFSCGSFLKIKNLGYVENDFRVPIFNIPYINSIIKDLNMTRTRIMNLKSKTCYSYHKDYSKRIHIPIITNENCFMIIDKKLEHYPANGTYYIADTTKYHTAVNASWEDRIHIVGVI